MSQQPWMNIPCGEPIVLRFKRVDGDVEEGTFVLRGIERDPSNAFGINGWCAIVAEPFRDGLRLVPLDAIEDVSTAREQSRNIAVAPGEADDQAFIDSVSILNDGQGPD